MSALPCLATESLPTLSGPSGGVQGFWVLGFLFRLPRVLRQAHGLARKHWVESVSEN